MIWGAIQSLGLFLLAVVGFGVAAQASGQLSTAGVLALAGTYLGSAGLSVRHRSAGRVRTATGVAIGAVLWPAVGCGLAYWAVAEMMKGLTVPY